jgi:hypothetical protein
MTETFYTQVTEQLLVPQMYKDDGLSLDDMRTLLTSFPAQRKPPPFHDFLDTYPLLYQSPFFICAHHL